MTLAAERSAMTDACISQSGEMTNRERALAVLRYQPYDRLPIVHFGYWHNKTLIKWAEQGHLPMDVAKAWNDGNWSDVEVAGLMGFDLNWQNMFCPSFFVRPGFERKVIRELPDGSRHVLNGLGVVLVEKPGAGSIPAEIEHTLTDRASWEEHYVHRMQWCEERVTKCGVNTGSGVIPFDEGGLDFLRESRRDVPYGLHCGSLYGNVRNALGVTGACYLQVDDEELFDEILDATAELCYRNVRYVLESGARFDFAHFWEDICFKNGPLITPAVFEEKVGPHYKRITALCRQHGIDIISLDCDGKIDALLPIWFENGVNTMFPIEVGTWNASIEPWREKYGKGLLGVGGMNKSVFAHDRAAVDAEIERLRPLVDLGGFLPCPDHRIADDAKFELVKYYCERMKEVFWK